MTVMSSSWFAHICYCSFLSIFIDQYISAEIIRVGSTQYLQSENVILVFLEIKYVFCDYKLFVRADLILFETK